MVYFSVVKFHPNIEKLQLFTAADDYEIRIWDLRSSKLVTVLENHYSVITSVQFSLKSNTLYSAGRDNIVTVWNLENNSKEKTIPVYEVNIEEWTSRSFLYKIAGQQIKLKLSMMDIRTSSLLHIWNRLSSTSCLSEVPVQTEEAKHDFIKPSSFPSDRQWKEWSCYLRKELFQSWTSTAAAIASLPLVLKVSFICRI